MIRRVLLSLGFVATLSAMAPPSASAQQSVSFFLGGFVPRTGSSRANDDVLINNRDFLDFHIRDLNGVTAGGEWLVALGDRFDAGLGVGAYSKSTTAVDHFLTYPSGALIVSELKLRVVPFFATVRWLPLGHHDAFEPYLGAGVGIYSWRYTETGDFIGANNAIVNGRFVGSGSAVGPLVLGGIRVPAGPVAIGGEIRYQAGEGDLPGGEGFSGSKIDLGGFNYLATVSFRF